MHYYIFHPATLLKELSQRNTFHRHQLRSNHIDSDQTLYLKLLSIVI